MPMYRPLVKALIAIGLALSVLGIGGWILHLTIADPGTAFLGGGGQARWIIYPRPADTKAHPLVEMGATFRRSFQVAGSPARAVLEIRAFRRSSVSLNGTTVPIPPRSSWKEVHRIDVAHL